MVIMTPVSEADVTYGYAWGGNKEELTDYPVKIIVSRF